MTDMHLVFGTGPLGSAVAEELRERGIRVVMVNRSGTGRLDGRETCLVLVSGRARIRAGAEEFGMLGERTTPFSGKPWSVYVPPGLGWSAAAEGDCELAVCSAPASATQIAKVFQ